MYSTGLRVSELSNLKICDVEFGKASGKVVKGKGDKDRYFKISKVLSDQIKNHINKRTT